MKNKLIFLTIVSLIGYQAKLHAQIQVLPNVVLIMADDVSWEAFGCYGAEDYQTPHLYPTLADIAGIKLGQGDPMDGVSFLPQLRGEVGSPRDWILCHYQSYWNKQPGQFARTADFKLYRDGRFYQPAGDLQEKQNLARKLNGEQQIDAHRRLQALLETAPPAPTEKGSKQTKDKDRHVYPEWKKEAIESPCFSIGPTRFQLDRSFSIPFCRWTSILP